MCPGLGLQSVIVSKLCGVRRGGKVRCAVTRQAVKFKQKPSTFSLRAEEEKYVCKNVPMPGVGGVLSLVSLSSHQMLLNERNIQGCCTYLTQMACKTCQCCSIVNIKSSLHFS